VKGLLAISPTARDRAYRSRERNDPIRYADAVVVAPDGTIYFTDASTRLRSAQWAARTGERARHHRAIRDRPCLAHVPATGRTRIVARGFSFANGVALSSDGHSLFVNETGRYRLWKIDGGERPRRAKRIAAGQGAARQPAGIPDNLMRGRDGHIWVGLFKPRNPAADSLAERPFLRKILLRLPRFLLPLGSRTGTSSPSTRTVASRPTYRTRAALILRPQV